MTLTRIITGDKCSFFVEYEKGDFQKPCVIFFHPSVEIGGNIENNTIKTLYNLFLLYGFSVVRMSLPETKTQGKKNKASIVPHIKIGNATIQWFKDFFSFNGNFWAVGVGHGSSISMQMFMRNPSVVHSVLVDPYIKASDITHVPHENNIISMFWGEKDEIFQNSKYLQTILDFLRLQKKVCINSICLKDQKSLSLQESLHPLKIAFDSFLTRFV
jgi:alpha/beta superfamily hydrolase